MREIRSETLVEVDPADSIPGMLAERLLRDPTGTFAERQVDGAWTAVTVAEFVAEVTAVAKGLVAHGIEPGERVAIMSRTRYEWTLLDFACWAAGTASSTAVISVRIDSLASDFTLRSAASAEPAATTTVGSAAVRSGSATGHDARCTEPSRHHDQTSSVANGSTGANRRSSTSRAIARAARADSVSGDGSPYARSLTSSR